MKRNEIQSCVACGKGIMHDNSIVFYRLRIRYMVADLGALQRAHGAEMMMGSPALAAVLGPDEDLAKVVSDHDVFVCLECIHTPLASIIETIPDEDDTRATEGADR